MNEPVNLGYCSHDRSGVSLDCFTGLVPVTQSELEQT
jgi:hypothetical protein